MDEKKVLLLADVAGGLGVRDAAAKYDVHYTTAVKWRNEARKDAENQKVDEVTELSPVALQTIVNEIKEKEPQGSMVGAQAQEIIEGVDGLQKLNSSFHSVCLKLIKKAEEMLAEDDLKIAEWKMISTTIGELYSNIFNKGGVNIQMMNNNGGDGGVSSTSLNLFKGSLK